MMFEKQIDKLVYILILMLMMACSSNIPPDIREPVEAAANFTAVQANAQAYQSNRFRWAGVILGTENKQSTSWMTIIAFPVGDNGRPRITAQSPGRFIAVANEFLEPLVYSQKREITVIGKLIKTEILKIGEYDYEYPVIEVENYYLWPPRPERIDMQTPYYRPYHPFYGWPYFPHPYYYR